MKAQAFKNGGEAITALESTKAVDVPVIAGIGGSMLYLVDKYGTKGSVYDAEFEYIKGVDKHPKGFGLTFVDHLTHNLYFGNMEKFASFYVNVPNTNDCGWIGDAVAAAAGATMPYQNWSTDPDENVDGGFWRIAYRGSDETNPVSDWSTLVQPGDIVLRSH